MIKVIAPMVLLFLNFSAKAQNKGGEATYKVIMEQDTTFRNSKNLYDYYQKAIFGAKNIELKLTFNSNKSVFGLVDKIEESDTKFAIAWCNCRKTIYTDLENKRTLYNNSNDRGIFKKNEFLIIDSIKSDWEITQESKKIQNFQCYKAIQTVKIKSIDKEITRVITAWFAHSIPFSVGPRGYAGLPGLILELHENKQVFGITNLKLFDTEVKIDLPTEGKKVSPFEFDVIFKDRRFEQMVTKEKSR